MSTTICAPMNSPASAAPALQRAAGQPGAARPGSSVRLTRRGRLVVFALGLLVAFGLGIWLASGSIATSSEGGAPEVEVVTVGHGDTLWDIAGDAAAATGSSDVRSMMERITELNSLDSSVVYAGQDLQVPTS